MNAVTKVAQPVGVDWDALTGFGFSCFAIPPRQKAAGGKWGQYRERKPTPDEIALWKQHPEVNAGIVTGPQSGILVLDVDSAEALAEARRRGLPHTPYVRTASGFHFYFKFPGGNIRNFAGKLGGMDLRADGGYVVAPGSVHPSGTLYEWHASPAQLPFADPPEWLLELTREKPKPQPASAGGTVPDAATENYCRKALENGIDRIRTAREGQRNHTLNAEAYAVGQLAHLMGWGEAFLIDTLMRPAIAAGLDRIEAEKTATSGVRSGMAEPKELPPLNNPANDVYEQVLASAEKGNGSTATAAAVPGLPVPDMGVLNMDPVEPPPFPLEVFRSIAPYLDRQAKSCSAPVDYVAGPFLSAAGVCIGNARHALPWHGWTEAPILWSAIVGDPSTKKTPAMQGILRPLKSAQRTLAEPYKAKRQEYDDVLTIYKARQEQWKSDVRQAVKDGTPKPSRPDCEEPEEPHPPRLYSSDMTTEAAAQIAAHNPKGFLTYRDELSAWMEGMDRYAKGGDRGFWLECYNGGSHDRDRKGDGWQEVDYLGIAVTGGIQPDRLYSLFMCGDDDGLFSRFLLFWPNPVRPRRPDRGGAEDVFRGILETLALRLQMDVDENGKPRHRLVPFSADASALVEEWQKVNFDAALEANGLMKSHYGKLDGMAVRMALILEFIEWAMHPDRPEPAEVSAESFALAAHFLSAYAAPMANRVYRKAGMNMVDRNATALARRIRRERLTIINSRELGRSGGLRGVSGSQRADHARDVCNALVEAGWLLPPEASGKAGRTKADYAVNPRCHE